MEKGSTVSSHTAFEIIRQYAQDQANGAYETVP
jgi:hypothetical protein